jgi:hypothetical protein
MARRERLFGIAEKIPKNFVQAPSPRRKVVALEARRPNKGR